MLFWSFILAFALGVLYYAFYPRTDYISVVEKPISESAIIAFVNAHQAAKRMLYRIDDDGLGGKEVVQIFLTEMPKVDANDKIQTPIIFEKQAEGDNDTIGQLKNSIRNNVIRGLKATKTDGIYSYVACLKKNVDETNNTSKELTFACDEDRTENYLITFSDHPDWWNENIKQRQLWRSALLKKTKGSDECGVVYCRYGAYEQGHTVVCGTPGGAPTVSGLPRYDSTSKYVLDNTQRFTVSIPKEISAALENKAGGNLYDFMLCITPIRNIMQNAQDEADRMSSVETTVEVTN